MTSKTTNNFHPRSGRAVRMVLNRERAPIALGGSDIDCDKIGCTPQEGNEFSLKVHVGTKNLD